MTTTINLGLDEYIVAKNMGTGGGQTNQGNDTSARPQKVTTMLNRSHQAHDIEVRSTATGNTLSGYAILWNNPSKEIREGGRKFTETIERSAFDLAKQTNDVKLFFQHQSDMPLARSANGSLELRNDPKGLHFSAELPNTSLGNDVKELIRTGILTAKCPLDLLFKTNAGVKTTLNEKFQKELSMNSLSW